MVAYKCAWCNSFNFAVLKNLVLIIKLGKKRHRPHWLAEQPYLLFLLIKFLFSQLRSKVHVTKPGLFLYGFAL